MSLTEKEREFTNHIFNDLIDKKKKYSDVENLSIKFYDYYKDFLIQYKSEGFSQFQMIGLLTYLYENNEQIAEFVYELLDLVHGNCAFDYKIFP